jgi:hypothetical protein
MSWSPYDTKLHLIKIANERGLECDISMLKADIIALLESVPNDDVDPVMTSAEVKEDAYNSDASFTGEPKPPMPDKPRQEPKKKTKPMNVLSILKDSVDPVSLDDLVDKLGPGAANEAKKLLADRKITQLRRGNKFWYIAF